MSIIDRILQLINDPGIKRIITRYMFFAVIIIIILFVQIVDADNPTDTDNSVDTARSDLRNTSMDIYAYDNGERGIIHTDQQELILEPGIIKIYFNFTGYYDNSSLYSGQLFMIRDGVAQILFSTEYVLIFYKQSTVISIMYVIYSPQGLEYAIDTIRIVSEPSDIVSINAEIELNYLENTVGNLMGNIRELPPRMYTALNINSTQILEDDGLLITADVYTKGSSTYNHRTEMNGTVFIFDAMGLHEVDTVYLSYGYNKVGILYLTPVGFVDNYDFEGIDEFTGFHTLYMNGSFDSVLYGDNQYIYLIRTTDTVTTSQVSISMGYPIITLIIIRRYRY